MSDLLQDPGPAQFEAGIGYFGNFFLESNGPSLTARAGGGQSGATLLAYMVNNVATVATINDSVLLPPAYPGMVLQVNNAATNAMMVYGQGSDTINGTAASTGVQQMGQSTVTYTCAVKGAWTAQGIGCGYAAGYFPTWSVQYNITASTTHSQTGGTPITASQAMISVCANVGDAVTLPVAKQGMELTLLNNGAQGAQVYGNGTDTINGTAGSSGITLATGTPTLFFCFQTGSWVTK